MKIDDADEPPAEDAEAEGGGPEKKTPGDQHRQQDPVRHLKFFLEGVFFCGVHFSHT